MRSKRPVSAYNTDEMEEHSDAYVEFVMEQLELAKQSCTDPLILIEQRLDFSCYVPQGSELVTASSLVTKIFT